MTSPKDVLPLEESQGDRKPRNERELTAQGYMLGNCAHCHNPHGFPSVIAPELRDALNFFPSKDGGIFQFPLDKFSPRIFRGPERDVPIPYITPSLYDRVAGPEAVKQITYDVANELTGLPETKPLLAPWRSLIYRNTDTPFSYADDSAIFPHMPLDTAGYDCRTRQIFGSWMASIPAKWKLEDDIMFSAIDEISTDADPQPYLEVLPDDPEFRRYERLAKSRVKDFQNSLRYKDCPDPTLDVVDPAVMNGTQIVPKPTFEEVKNADGEVVGHISLPMPEREHWAVTDLTDPPGDWNPRRPDWKDVLVDHVPQEDSEEQAAIDLIRDSNIRVTGQDALHSLATDDQPFGMWLVKDGCDFSSQKKVSDLSPRPAWADVVGAPDDAPVYEISYGAQVFTAICSNCHGPLADSTGRLASTIADMTGGQTRVANLRDGILGPVSDPGSNRQRIFGIENNLGLTADDFATRYMLWMGLGGTQRVIPRAALAVVGSTSVLGERRTGVAGFTATSANMLTAASFLCTQVLPAGALAFDPSTGRTDHTNKSLRSALITKNGDVDMWERLCSFNKPPPVRMVFAKVDNGHIARFEVHHPTNALTMQVDYALFERESYPADQPVGDPTGAVTTGIQADNSDPWCIHRPEIPGDEALIEAYWTGPTNDGGLARTSPVPFCPESQLQRLDDAAVNRWSMRGAMNAGLSVFLYLDALAHGDKQRPVPYDHCEDIKK
jgi:mono/diheme cytochrome c family protein